MTYKLEILDSARIDSIPFEQKEKVASQIGRPVTIIPHKDKPFELTVPAGTDIKRVFGPLSKQHPAYIFQLTSNQARIFFSNGAYQRVDKQTSYPDFDPRELTRDDEDLQVELGKLFGDLLRTNGIDTKQLKHVVELKTRPDLEQLEAISVTTYSGDVYTIKLFKDVEESSNG